MRKFLTELAIFTKKQASASVFGAVLLGLMLLTAWIDPATYTPFTRYDFLFVSAVLFQIGLVLFRYERLREVAVIFVFHIVATIMELFKTHPAIGSWRYPDDLGLFTLLTIPLFVGFLYSAVGSYIARAWRIFRLRFSGFPRLRYMSILAFAIYANFFTHHFGPDIRWFLLTVTIVLFWRTRVHFVNVKTERSMPLLLGFFLIAIFIYIAENIGTFGAVWIYPSQETAWQIVPLHKLGSWFLLLIVSFTLVALLYRDHLWRDRITRD